MDVVLGMAAGYDWPKIELFVRSLRQSSYDGELVLFSNEVTPELRRWSEPFRVTFVPFEARFPRPEVARYAAVADFLKGKRYRYLFLTDTRDVFFQGNVFDHAQDCMLVFEEDASMTIGKCLCNSLWVIGCYGYDPIANFSIICSGTILGTQASIETFLWVFLDELVRLGPPNFIGADQRLRLRHPQHRLSRPGRPMRKREKNE